MALRALTQRWVADRLPERSPRAHKGTFGRVLVVAGSNEYAGAALLAGMGAARSGAGLVCLATPESVGLRLSWAHAGVHRAPARGGGARPRIARSGGAA